MKFITRQQIINTYNVSGSTISRALRSGDLHPDREQTLLECKTAPRPKYLFEVGHVESWVASVNRRGDLVMATLEGLSNS